MFIKANLKEQSLYYANYRGILPDSTTNIRSFKHDWRVSGHGLRKIVNDLPLGLSFILTDQEELINLNRRSGHQYRLRLVSATPIKELIALGPQQLIISYQDGSIHLSNYRSTVDIYLVSHDQDKVELQVSLDQQYLLTYSKNSKADTELLLWKLSDHKLVSSFSVGQAIWSVNETPNGWLIAAGSDLYQWQPTLIAEPLFPDRELLALAQYKASNRWAVAFQDGTISWQQATARVDYWSNSQITGLYFDPSGEQLLYSTRAQGNPNAIIRLDNKAQLSSRSTVVDADCGVLVQVTDHYFVSQSSTKRYLWYADGKPWGQLETDLFVGTNPYWAAATKDQLYIQPLTTPAFKLQLNEPITAIVAWDRGLLWGDQSGYLYQL